jgi:2'-5' RNA ligase
MARLFFAVAVSPGIASRLRALEVDLARLEGADALRFMLPEQAHYTLRFLGALSEERHDAAARAGALAAREAKAFDVDVETSGVFADERRPHTLWIGAGRGAADLVALAAGLSAALFREGFPKEERAFVPHMTLARAKRRLGPATLASFLSAGSEALGRLRVHEFKLFESRPSRSGAVYVPLASFRLHS